MPRQKGTGKGSTKPITLRLDDDTETFYKRKANEHGISLSEYLRQTLVQGVIAENIREAEERIRALFAEARAAAAPAVDGAVSDDLQLAVYTCEAMLIAIVEARDTQALYDAQNAARAKLKKLKGA